MSIFNQDDDGMNGSGIIRRIDDLGRVAIPKEIRRYCCLRENDAIEITTVNGGIFLKPHRDTDIQQCIRIAQVLDDVVCGAVYKSQEDKEEILDAIRKVRQALVNASRQKSDMCD